MVGGCVYVFVVICNLLAVNQMSKFDCCLPTPFSIQTDWLRANEVVCAEQSLSWQDVGANAHVSRTDRRSAAQILSLSLSLSFYRIHTKVPPPLPNGQVPHRTLSSELLVHHERNSYSFFKIWIL